jgi:predicted nicotinamide N-methyase
MKGRDLNTSSTATRKLADLQRRLTARFKLLQTSVALPEVGVEYRIDQPTRFDSLLEAASDDPEEQIPYWAVLWPSGIALASIVLRERGAFTGQSVLELGCGLGMTAAAALAAGAKLLVTDYSTETLMLCRYNTLRNTGQEPETLQLNWRKPNAALLHRAPFPIVLAADVLYEARDVEPLLSLVDHLVAPGGTLWLAEPGRRSSQQFVAAARERGWNDEVTEHRGPWPDPKETNVVVHVHRMRRNNETP